MLITLTPAGPEDAPALLEIQRRAFAALLEKYRDYDTNPAAEPLEKVRRRLHSPERDYWFILAEDRPVGLACVRQAGNGRCISPIGLLPEWQGRGLGRQAMRSLEAHYPNASHWELATILQEPGLCHFYESQGYHRTGEETHLRTGMTIVGFVKKMVEEGQA